MLRDSIYMTNFNFNPVVLQKFGKISKIAIFGTNLHKEEKKGSVWAMPKTKKQILFAEITKEDHTTNWGEFNQRGNFDQLLICWTGNARNVSIVP